MPAASRHPLSCILVTPGSASYALKGLGCVLVRRLGYLTSFNVRASDTRGVYDLDVKR